MAELKLKQIVDKLNTEFIGEHDEDAVFEVCERAVDEIAALIPKIATSANTYRFVVRADHGFIYKRDKVTASDKIGGMSCHACKAVPMYL